MNEMVSEVKRNENLARTVAASASTDDIREGRAAQVFNSQLAAELRQAREATSVAKGDVSRMEAEKREFFEQQMLNESEKARRKKMDNEKLVEASSAGGPPPPTPGAGKIKKRTRKLGDCQLTTQRRIHQVSSQLVYNSQVQWGL